MIKVSGFNIAKIPINGKNTIRVMQNGKELWNYNRLTIGYILLEYIKSTGTQYIDTGFKPNNNTRLKIECGGCQKTGWLEIFGTGNSVQNPSKNFLLVSNISNGAQMQYNTEYYTAIITNNRDVIDADRNKFYVNGSLVKTFTSSSFTSPYNLTLFQGNTSGNDYPYYEGKVYSCQIYDNGKLVRDFIPAKNQSGVAGLYDIANDVFYPSATSTEFIAGPEIENQFTLLEYIESNGSQYIDTGFKPNNNTRVLMDVICEPSTTSTSEYICGSRVSASSSQFGLETISSAYNARYGTSTVAVMNGIVSKRQIVDINKNVFTVNGKSVTVTSQTFVCTSSLFLFAMNNNGSIFRPVSAMRLYSCKIYDNGTLVRDYIPVLRYDGSYGLYDKVNKRFYNSASGTPFTGA